MIWIFLLLVHLVGLVGYSLLLRRTAVAGKFHPWVLATLLQTGIMTPMLLAAPFLPIDMARFDARSVALAATAVGLGIVVIVAITKALHYLEASMFSVVYSVRIVAATALAAVLLSEFPTYWQLIGGVFVLAATMIVRQKSNTGVTKRGVLWGVGAAAALSVLSIVEKQLILDVGVFTAAPLVTLTVGVVMWLVVAVRRLPLPAKSTVFNRNIIGLMVLRSISTWGFIFALAAGALVSVATLVSAMSIVFIVALGMIVLGERDYMVRKIVAVVLASAGLMAIIFGK